MAFLRFTRDSRGYEYTFLLHATHLGERPRVLYWYRSAPGVRVGRPALDEEAIRTIEDQHPDVDFDWPHILEVGAATPPEVERRPERRRRKPSRPEESAEPIVSDDAAPAPTPPRMVGTGEPPAVAPSVRDEARPETPRNPLLEELVGREIAARLRIRYSEVAARIQQIGDPVARETWASRAQALNPDAWTTPVEILTGVERADELFDELRRDLPS